MQDVLTNRERYIGGSDIPVILGISPFKTRWQLVQEKASGKVETQSDNDTFTEKYKNYGNVMEPKIRDYINEDVEDKFVEGKYTNEKEKVRCHTDGENLTTIIEIKTASKIYDAFDDYSTYKPQLIFYMNKQQKNGILYVYERPDNFDEEFDPLRLHKYEVDLKDYKEYAKILDAEVAKFWNDVEKVKENPLLTEQDLKPNEVVVLTNKIIILEEQLKKMKEIENQCKDLKDNLYKVMQDNNIKNWETPNGTKISMVEEVKDSTTIVKKFDTDSFKDENEELYKKYEKNYVETKKGKKGYVKITLPKNKEE